MKKLLSLLAACVLASCSNFAGPEPDERSLVTVYVQWDCDGKGSDLYVYEDGRLISVTLRRDVYTVRDTLRCVDGAALSAEFRLEGSDVTRKRETTAADKVTWVVKP